MRNNPICLPKLENLSSHKPKFARIFATTTQDNCKILDTFVRLEETKNCSSSSVICGMSPDQRDCQWVKNDSFLTSSSSQASIQLLGMASGFSTCQDQRMARFISVSIRLPRKFWNGWRKKYIQENVQSCTMIEFRIWTCTSINIPFVALLSNLVFPLYLQCCLTK